MSSGNNRNALITGAAKRIGREIAIELAKQGWNIALHYHTTSPTDVVKELESYGVKATTIQADLNIYSQTRDVLLKANEELGEISLLINNASIFEKYKFMDTDEDIFNRHMNINFKAPFFLCQDFARQCKGSGHIVNILDTKVTQNKTTYFSYLASKKSLAELSGMLALEMAPNIRVNAISIGVTELSDDIDQQYLDDRVNSLPLKKKTTLDEINKTLSFLIQNDYLTGQNIFIDSGEQLI